MKDPILKLFNQYQNLDDILFKREGSEWEMAIKCEIDQGRDSVLKSTYRNGEWQSSLFHQGRKKWHENPTNLLSEQEIYDSLPQAMELVIAEVNQRPNPKDLRKLEKQKTTRVHAASPMHLHHIHYFRDNNSVEREYFIQPHVTFPMTLFPSRRSYKAKEPSGRGRFSSPSESSLVLRP